MCSFVNIQCNDGLNSIAYPYSHMIHSIIHPWG
nr:MAG TPA_asm: hypothetical protein [Caudoviricetes sp.]